MVILKNIQQVSHEDDEVLLMRYKQTAKQDVLATLYMRYTDLVYGASLKYLSDAEAAKDAVIDIYQELIDKALKHDIQQFKSWLYVLTKNHCLMRLRKEKKNITVELAPTFMHLENTSHLDDILEKENDFKKMEACLSALPFAQKRTIELFYYENKCYQEIAELMEEDWGKVRSLIQNGRRNLKICMEKK